MKFQAKLFDMIITAFTAPFIGGFLGEGRVSKDASPAGTIEVHLSIFDVFSWSLHCSCSTSRFSSKKKRSAVCCPIFPTAMNEVLQKL